jgi:hypothetical protein
VRFGKWKYVRDQRRRARLIDVDADVGKIKDRAESEPAGLQQLAARWVAHNTEFRAEAR